MHLFSFEMLVGHDGGHWATKVLIILHLIHSLFVHASFIIHAPLIRQLIRGKSNPPILEQITNTPFLQLREQPNKHRLNDPIDQMLITVFVRE